MKITKQNIRDTMKKRGFTFIGSGSFALVFKSFESHEVVKFFKNDPGYVTFLKIIGSYPNIHFPKFRGYAALPNWDGWHVVKLESLMPITNEDFYQHYNWISYYCEGLLLGANIVPKNLKEEIDKSVKANPTLEQACMTLVVQRPRGHNLDIHEDNLMMRSDGTLIIIDPYV